MRPLLPCLLVAAALAGAAPPGQSGPTARPTTFRQGADGALRGSDGEVLRRGADGAVRSSLGPTARRMADGSVRFSDGVSARTMADGSIRTSEGLSLRRMADGSWQGSDGSRVRTQADGAVVVTPSRDGRGALDPGRAVLLTQPSLGLGPRTPGRPAQEAPRIPGGARSHGG
jgi:hypothetical protein